MSPLQIIFTLILIYQSKTTPHLSTSHKRSLFQVMFQVIYKYYKDHFSMVENLLYQNLQLKWNSSSPHSATVSALPWLWAQWIQSHLLQHRPQENTTLNGTSVHCRATVFALLSQNYSAPSASKQSPWVHSWMADMPAFWRGSTWNSLWKENPIPHSSTQKL